MAMNSSRRSLRSVRIAFAGRVAFSVNFNELSPVDAARVEQIVIGLLVAGTLYVTMIGYGQLVAAGVIEEKSNRILEILLATVRPWQLMLGKIIGIGLVALVQVVIVALVFASATKLVSIPTLGFDVVISDVVWFVLGYLIYAPLFAAAGSIGVTPGGRVHRGDAGDPGARRPVYPRAHRRRTRTREHGDHRLLAHPAVLADDHAGARRGGCGAALASRAQRDPRARATIYVLAALAGRIYRNAVLRIGSRVKLADALGSRKHVG